jgi:hypothetical protein
VYKRDNGLITGTASLPASLWAHNRHSYHSHSPEAYRHSLSSSPVHQCPETTNPRVSASGMLLQFYGGRVTIHSHGSWPKMLMFLWHGLHYPHQLDGHTSSSDFTTSRRFALKDFSEGCYATTGPEKIVAVAHSRLTRVSACRDGLVGGGPQTSAFRHGIYLSMHNIYSPAAFIRFFYNPPLLASLACDGQQSRFKLQD